MQDESDIAHSKVFLCIAGAFQQCRGKHIGCCYVADGTGHFQVLVVNNVNCEMVFCLIVLETSRNVTELDLL